MKELLIILQFLPLCGFAQLSAQDQSQVDSLQLLIKTASHDSTTIKAWKKWDNLIYISDPQLDFELNVKIEKLCEQNLKEELSSEEISFFSKAQASSLNVIGIIYKNQGKLNKAIDYYSKSQKLYKELDDQSGMARVLGNIGNIYSNLKDHSKAIEYHKQSLEIKEKINDKRGIANSLNNLGKIYADQNKITEGMDHFSRSLKIREELHDQKGIAQCLANLGKMYEARGQLDSALDHYARSLEIRDEIDDKSGISNSLNYIGDINLAKGNLRKCIEFNSRSLEIALEINIAKEIKNSSRSLSTCYEQLGQHKEALKMYKLFVQTRDTIASEANQKEVLRQEYKATYERQAVADSIQYAENQKVKDAELLTQKAENKRHVLESEHQQLRAYFLYGGLGLVLVFAGFMFNRFKVTNRQKSVIEEQKGLVDKAFDELEEKNTEIMDSIAYAKRIQSAILPPRKVVKEYLRKSFVLYKPKDVVAGDFYWLETKLNKILFAAADCTGHGVPGAMVSVMCVGGLNRSVNEFSLTDPGKILDKTRELVIAEFEKSEEEVKDGMDIALCSLEGLRLKYSGAHNALWVIRKGAEEVEEIKANKQPIGKYAEETPFDTHEILLKQGDSFYIASDGYADQFGGEKGKKFKSKNFKQLLVSIQNEPMEKQLQLLDEAFENWRGNLEQVDDVCVIGVRV